MTEALVVVTMRLVSADGPFEQVHRSAWLHEISGSNTASLMMLVVVARWRGVRRPARELPWRRRYFSESALDDVGRPITVTLRRSIA